MAITILPREVSGGERIGESFGQGLQSGLGGLLNQLAQQRALEMQSVRTAPALQNLLNLTSPQEANAYAQLLAYNPQIAKAVIGARTKLPFPQEGSDIRQFVPGLSDEQVKAYSVATPGEKGIILRDLIENPGRYLKSAAPQVPQVAPKVQANLLEAISGPQAPAAAPGAPKTTEQVLQPLENLKVKDAEEPKAKSAAELMAENPLLSRTEAKEIAKEERKKIGEKPKIAEKQQERLDKKYLPYEEKVNKEADAAKANIDRLKRMHELVETNNLASPTAASFIESLAKIPYVGFDLTGLLSPESQEFRKLSRDFLTSAKDVFGARITEGEVKLFLDRVPNLAQSDGGKIAVINNLMRMAEGSLLKQEAMRDLIEKNNGEIPKNLDKLVDHKIKPELDKLAKDFARGGHRRVLKTFKAPKKNQLSPGLLPQTSSTLNQLLGIPE